MTTNEKRFELIKPSGFTASELYLRNELRKDNIFEYTVLPAQGNLL